MFIVIEIHGGAEYATIVTDQDGNNLVFDNYSEAETEAKDCQVGIVIELQNSLKLVKTAQNPERPLRASIYSSTTSEHTLPKH